MKILILDSSSRSASAAICEDGRLLGEYYTNNGKTHSATLLPMTEGLLRTCSLTIGEMDALAVTVGPGSFTGLRIGMAAGKGMAFAAHLPCIPLSTLEGLAWNLQGTDALICPVLDARVSQVYTALFRCRDGVLTRLTEDCAIPIRELETLLHSQPDEHKILVGDGAKLCYNKFENRPAGLVLAPEHLLYQRAGAMAGLAWQKVQAGETLPANEIVPAYLRLPQAERELQLKQQQKGE